MLFNVVVVCFRWCLYLRHLSSSAYEVLRNSGVLVLPSQRTLRDYTYYTESAPGFSLDVDTEIMDTASIQSCPERERHVVIILDEMHVRENIVYNKHTGIPNKYNMHLIFNYQLALQAALLVSLTLVM